MAAFKWTTCEPRGADDDVGQPGQHQHSHGVWQPHGQCGSQWHCHGYHQGGVQHSGSRKECWRVQVKTRSQGFALRGQPYNIYCKMDLGCASHNYYWWRNLSLAKFVFPRCPPGYSGLSCEMCSSGFERVPDGLYLGTCAGCNCNGHASACDPISGHCLVISKSLYVCVSESWTCLCFEC